VEKTASIHYYRIINECLLECSETRSPCTMYIIALVLVTLRCGSANISETVQEKCT